MKTQANKKKRGLGKGLDTLMNDSNHIITDIIDRSNTSTLAINALQAGESQPRKSFSDDSIESLSDSIKQHGILQPLIVRAVSEDIYEIIAGERRFRAAQRAGLKTVPVKVLSLTDTQASEIALVENIQREDLSSIEEAEGYSRMMSEFSYTQEMLSKTIGKSRSHIANTLRLLSLSDEIKAFITNGKLSPGHARTLIGIDNANSIAQDIISQEMSVRDTERFINKIKNNSTPKEARKIDPIVNQEEEIAMQILRKNTGLTAKVKIDKNGKGQITLYFDKKEDLEALLYKLQ